MAVKNLDELELQWGHRLSVMDMWDDSDVPAVWDTLQWGHRLSVMDIGALANCHLLMKVLQWGHRLSVMDIATYACGRR